MGRFIVAAVVFAALLWLGAFLIGRDIEAQEQAAIELDKSLAAVYRRGRAR